MWCHAAVALLLRSHLMHLPSWPSSSVRTLGRRTCPASTCSRWRPKQPRQASSEAVQGMLTQGRKCTAGHTCKASAALLRSKTPSGALSTSPTNFFVNRPNELSYRQFWPAPASISTVERIRLGDPPGSCQHAQLGVLEQLGIPGFSYKSAVVGHVLCSGKAAAPQKGCSSADQTCETGGECIRRLRGSGTAGHAAPAVA